MIGNSRKDRPSKDKMYPFFSSQVLSPLPMETIRVWSRGQVPAHAAVKPAALPSEQGGSADPTTPLRPSVAETDAAAGDDDEGSDTSDEPALPRPDSR